jgi:hypothetical protein
MRDKFLSICFDRDAGFVMTGHNKQTDRGHTPDGCSRVSEALAPVYQNTRRHFPEGNNLNIHCRQNFKPPLFVLFLVAVLLPPPPSPPFSGTVSPSYLPKDEGSLASSLFRQPFLLMSSQLLLCRANESGRAV